MGSCCNHEHEHDHGHEHNEEESKFEKVLTIVGTVILIVTLILDKKEIINSNYLMISYIISYIMIAYKIVLNGIKNVFKYKSLDENFLMTVATIGAIAIGEYFEGAMVILLYKVGEFLQDLAVDKSTEKIEKAIDIREEFANLKVGKEIKKVHSNKLKVGDIIVVKNGEKVPVDGKLISESATLDNSLITGESKPVKVMSEESVISGSINLSNVIEVEVMTEYQNSTVSKIVEFIENAGKNKSKTEKFITRFSKVYTPIVILIAVLITALSPLIFGLEFKEALSRGLIFLVISCPCALVISIPLGFFIGIGQCSKKGVVVKGSSYLDVLSNTKVMAFDKTGTLTNGNFKISEVKNKSDMSDEEFLKFISYAEYYSNHYLAKSILNETKVEIDKEKITDYKEISGKGVECKFDGKDVVVGSKSFMESKNIAEINESENVCGSKIHLAVDNDYKGYIVLADEPKENSLYTIEKLKKLNIKTLMLTGDNKEEAESVAKTLQVDEVYSKLLPEQKAAKIEELKNDKNIVAFVGDGINDSPVIAASNVGIAMGHGADISVEVANVIIMNDDPKSILESVLIAKRTKNIIKQNITFALVIKVLFLVLSSLGITSMWFAIFADVGVALLTVLNSFRIARKN